MSQSGRRLLVIDDDTIVRQSIAAYLEDSGFLVHQEADGHSALTWLMDNPPCLVLTDLRMPGTDGLTLLKAIREWDVELPVIVISGAGAVHDVAEALRHGASDYLVKPIVDMEVLVHFEKGFIRAEIIGYDDYIACKGEAGAKEAGKWRLEGKEYIVKDGDVIHFRFNV